MSITLEIPEHFTEAEARLELAIVLYREGRLPPGRAAQLAGMDRWDFEKILVERKVPMPWDEEDIENEFRNALRRS